MSLSSEQAVGIDGVWSSSDGRRVFVLDVGVLEPESRGRDSSSIRDAILIRRRFVYIFPAINAVMVCIIRVQSRSSPGLHVWSPC